MQRLLWIVGATIGSGIGWWIGAKVGIMTAFIVSTIGTALGVWPGFRIAREYLD